MSENKIWATKYIMLCRHNIINNNRNVKAGSVVLTTESHLIDGVQRIQVNHCLTIMAHKNILT